jgi:hypothetical protein
VSISSVRRASPLGHDGAPELIVPVIAPYDEGAELPSQ